MGKPTIMLGIGEEIRVNFMFDHSGKADCGTDHNLVVAKVRKRLTVNKQRSHRFHIERFNLMTLNEVEGKGQCRIKVSNRFAPLEDLNTEVQINGAWETIRKNVNKFILRDSGLFRIEEHTPWFHVVQTQTDA
jgi:hypothetical protein